MEKSIQGTTSFERITWKRFSLIYFRNYFSILNVSLPSLLVNDEKFRGREKSLGIFLLAGRSFPARLNSLTSFERHFRAKFFQIFFADVSIHLFRAVLFFFYNSTHNNFPRVPFGSFIFIPCP